MTNEIILMDMEMRWSLKFYMILIFYWSFRKLFDYVRFDFEIYENSGFTFCKLKIDFYVFLNLKPTFVSDLIYLICLIMFNFKYIFFSFSSFHLLLFYSICYHLFFPFNNTLNWLLNKTNCSHMIMIYETYISVVLS